MTKSVEKSADLLLFISIEEKLLPDLAVDKAELNKLSERTIANGVSAYTPTDDVMTV